MVQLSKQIQRLCRGLLFSGATLFSLMGFVPETKAAEPSQQYFPQQPPQYCPPGTVQPYPGQPYPGIHNPYQQPGQYMPGQNMPGQNLPAPSRPGTTEPTPATPTTPNTTDPGMTDPSTTPNTTPNTPDTPDPNTTPNTPDPNTNGNLSNPDDLFNNNSQPLTDQINPPQNAGNFDVAGSGNDSLAPGMIGDYFGPSGVSAGFFEDPLGLIFLTRIPNPSGSVVGRQKIAENNSPVPRNRIYMNYSYFQNVELINNSPDVNGPGQLNSDVNVNRMTVGLERASYNGRYSFELRLPFASTLDSNIDLFNNTSDTNWEFGNINVNWKVVLWSGPNHVVSGGLGLNLPTADDLTYTGNTAFTTLRVKNEALHVLPFLGFLRAAEGSGWFSQGFVQADFDANGNEIEVDGVETTHVTDRKYLYGSLGIGYDFFNARENVSWLTKVAPTLELHYSRSLNDGQVSNSIDANNNGIIFTTPQEAAASFETLNMVLGTALGLGDSAHLTMGYVVPLITDQNKQFDGEFRLTFNMFTAPGSRNRSLFRRVPARALHVDGGQRQFGPGL